MRNNRIRLTEEQLHAVIKESVKTIISELKDKHYDDRREMRHLKSGFMNNFKKGREEFKPKKKTYDSDRNERFVRRNDRSTGLNALANRAGELRDRTARKLGRLSSRIYKKEKEEPKGKIDLFNFD